MRVDVLKMVPSRSASIDKNAGTCLVRYRYARYRYGCRTKLTVGSGTGIDALPNLPKCPIPVLMLCRTYRRVSYWYGCCAELTEESRTGMDVVPVPVPTPVQTFIPVPAVYVPSILGIS